MEARLAGEGLGGVTSQDPCIDVLCVSGSALATFLSYRTADLFVLGRQILAASQCAHGSDQAGSYTFSRVSAMRSLGVRKCSGVQPTPGW